jgi:hypothetical protein
MLNYDIFNMPLHIFHYFEDYYLMAKSERIGSHQCTFHSKHVVTLSTFSSDFMEINLKTGWREFSRNFIMGIV